MKAFVTGVCGQLGHDLLCELKNRGWDVVGSDLNCKAETSFPYVTLDITNQKEVQKTISEIRPDVIFHCAAWTAVDDAEDADKCDLVKMINGEGTYNVSLAAKALDCKLFYISTDYVFDGTGDTPWKPDCKDYHPLSVYGQSKLDGEFAVVSNVSKFFIVRIAWVFGMNGKNFVRTMLRLGQTMDSISVVNDQIGTPTYTPDLSRLLADMAETDKYGYYHATNEGGFISWYDFACEIFRQAGLNTTVVPVSTAEYKASKAKRPLNSRLDKSKLTENGFERLPDWKDALARFLNNLKSIEQ